MSQFRTVQLASNCRMKLTFDDDNVDVFSLQIEHNDDVSIITSIDADLAEEVLNFAETKKLYIFMYNGGYYLTILDGKLTIEFHKEECSFRTIIILK